MELPPGITAPRLSPTTECLSIDPLHLQVSVSLCVLIRAVATSDSPAGTETRSAHTGPRLSWEVVTPSLKSHFVITVTICWLVIDLHAYGTRRQQHLDRGDKSCCRVGAIIVRGVMQRQPKGSGF